MENVRFRGINRAVSDGKEKFNPRSRLSRHVDKRDFSSILLYKKECHSTIICRLLIE